MDIRILTFHVLISKTHQALDRVRVFRTSKANLPSNKKPQIKKLTHTSTF